MSVTFPLRGSALPIGGAPHFTPSAARAAWSSRRLIPLALAALTVAPAFAGAQARPATAAARPAAAPAPASAFDSSAFAALRWREIGPYRGGRSAAVTGSVARPDEYWMGTTGGGVFRSSDGGRTWLPVTDKYYGGSIGAIAVDESNPDVVYVGTGEAPIRGNVTHGDGAWKTTDGGKTWTHLGLTETRQIARIRIDPTNPKRLWLAALGNVFMPTRERGIYRSEDAGATWKQVFFRDDSTGAVDLALEPGNPNVLYAAMWQAGRTPWTLSSGGKGSGIFKSTDGGDTWTDISHNPGLPEGVLGKIGITVSPVNPQRVWALVEANEGGVFRSDDGGRTWTRTNDDRYAAAARLVLLEHLRRPEGREHRLRAEHRLLPLDGRREDVPVDQRAARRQPRPVDRRQRPAAHDRVERRRCEREHRRREDVDRAGLRHGAVLSRDHQQRVSVPRLRRAAGQQHAVRSEREPGRHPYSTSGTTWAAARAATSRWIRATRTSPMPAATAAC